MTDRQAFDDTVTGRAAFLAALARGSREDFNLGFRAGAETAARSIEAVAQEWRGLPEGKAAVDRFAGDGGCGGPKGGGKRDGRAAVTATTEVNIDALPPTQWLVLEVLAARRRLGKRLWPFPSRLQPQIGALDRLGLVWQASGNVPYTVRAGLTDAGVKAMLHGPYVSPVHRPVERVKALATAAEAAGTVLLPSQVLTALGEA